MRSHIYCYNTIAGEGTRRTYRTRTWVHAGIPYYIFLCNPNPFDEGASTYPRPPPFLGRAINKPLKRQRC